MRCASQPCLPFMCLQDERVHASEQLACCGPNWLAIHVCDVPSPLQVGPRILEEAEDAILPVRLDACVANITPGGGAIVQSVGGLVGGCPQGARAPMCGA